MCDLKGMCYLMPLGMLFTRGICEKCNCHPLRGIYTGVFLRGINSEFYYLPFSLLKYSLEVLRINYVFQSRQFIILLGFPSMPTTRKQKKARESRGIEMLSDIENLDIMLGENHFNRNGRDESLGSNSARRPERENEFEHDDEDRHLDSRVADPSTNADYGQNSTECNSSAESNRLSYELNSRLSRELDEMVSSGNTLIQKAVSDAIRSQILPQIQSAINAGLGHLTQNRWNVPSERPETNPEVLQNACSRDNLRIKPNSVRPYGVSTDFRGYDNWPSEDHLWPPVMENWLTWKLSNR